ncbi:MULTISPECIES: dihydroneopterin triphosphate diphosphatase [Pantoea]|uniref:dihydroneopterin triphosphate diphosphatase n=1 Tax=Pantoea TaxID=53335 RepID=UPI00051CE128|nr:dihydroneopterin triphosphate diphosphatase [Pantoea ananatis]KGL53170.1 dihydroneopterin triphosphate pyrophosphatase [Pantoea ananatis]MBN6029455.1 dihydroneopterin triphosphate diphosphatase [Pantoea ananatis]MCW0329180.1 Dihydroneopterin triphosphate diphosphatase [Pantoea ananatis]
MGNKHPVSVLVVIYAQDTGRVLMLQRRDDDSFWQSVTGSLEVGETPRQAAEREVSEELDIHIADEGLVLEDCHKQIEFEIFPHYRHRYAPGITHNREHWFRLALPAERDLLLSEHLAARWLEPAVAAALTKSWSNRQAIEEFI